MYTHSHSTFCDTGKEFFIDEEDALRLIAQKTGVANGRRGPLNVMENVIINPLSDYIFLKSDVLFNRKILISSIGGRLIFKFDLE